MGTRESVVRGEVVAITLVEEGVAYQIPFTADLSFDHVSCKECGAGAIVVCRASEPERRKAAFDIARLSAAFGLTS